MNDESIRQLTAAIILNTYRNHCDAFNKLDDFIEQYNEILDEITPKLKIKEHEITAEDILGGLIGSNTGKIYK